jgi:hypothetical protein
MAMNAIEIACIMQEITKNLGIDMPCDATEYIYDIYKVSSYMNYTLLELLHMLMQKKYEITVPWNKKALIKMIEEQNLDIPTKLEQMLPTQWTHTRQCRDADVDTLHTQHMDIYKGFMFQDTQGHVQLVTNLSISYNENQKDLVWLQDITLASEEYVVKAVHAENFISQLDNEDITIVQHRDYDKFINPKEKKYWTLYYMRVDDPLYNIVKNSN